MRILRKLRHHLINARLNSAHRKHRAGKEGDYSTIDSVIERYRANGGIDHPWQHYKLFCLQELLQQRQPKRILELGSGTTTAVFADYVRSNPEAKLTVIDESAHWLENARQIARITESSQFDLQVAAANRVQRNGQASYEYDWRSDDAFDFVFIDGPTRHREKTATNGNIIDLLPQRPQTIVVDGRETVALMLDEILSGYKSELSEVFSQHYYPGYRYLSVFTNQQAHDGDQPE